AGPSPHPGPKSVGEAVADMSPEGFVEGVESTLAVGILQCRHFFQQIRMTADGALTELDEAAGDDVGAFDGDADRHAAIEAAKVVEWALDDALAAMHTQSVVDRDAHALCRLRFKDGGNDGRMMPIVKRRTSHATRRIEKIGGCRHTPEPLLYRFEPRDRDVELLADARIGTGEVGC